MNQKSEKNQTPLLLMENSVPEPPEYQELIREFKKLHHVDGLKLQNFPAEQLPENSAANSSEFLFNFLVEYRKKYNTVNESGRVVTTTGRYEKGAGHNRSVNEVFDLISSYYPNYSYENYFRDIYEVFARFNKNYQEFLNKKDEMQNLDNKNKILYCF